MKNCIAILACLLLVGCATGNRQVDQAQRYGMTGMAWGAGIGWLSGVATGVNPEQTAALGAMIGGGTGIIGGAIDNVPAGDSQPYYQPRLGMSDRGVIIDNASERPHIARLFGFDGANAQYVLIAPMRQGTFQLYSPGGKTGELSIWSVSPSGEMGSILASVRVSFNWGYGTGTGYHEDQNHKKFVFNGRSLSRL